MAFLIGGANSVTGGYEVANSCRFNNDDSAYMHKTPGGAGNRRTFTFSTWVKRGNLGDATLFTAGADSNVDAYFTIYFSSEAIRVRIYESSAKDVVTSMLFRDVTAWYHIVVAVDTTQGTAANRVKIYVNGSEAAKASGSYASEDFDTSVNNTVIQQVGVGRDSSGNLSNYFDGYLAETVLIDGSALTHTSFGEFDEDSPTIWKPIDVSGLTFGTNGFYLDFEDSSNLGNDANGGTDLTEVNLAATDQATDTPTNNFATFNPLSQPHSDKTFSEGNTKMTVAHAGGSHHVPAFSTIAVTAGKWYVEGKCTETNDTKWTHGIANVEFNYNKTGTTNWIPGRHDHSQDDTIGNYTDDVWKNGTETVSDLFGSTESDGDIVMMAIDCDNGKIWFGRNGTWNNGSATDSTTFNAASHDTTFTAGDDYVVHFVAEDTAWLANFGNPAYANSSSAADENGYGDFEYAPPSGFLAICTKNLGENGG